MSPRLIQCLLGGVAIACALQQAIIAQDCPLDMKRPACGKVCKLVCETKKLTDIGFGNECKSICLPGPSRPGCKHYAVCCGKCKCNPCTCCQESAPKCEFCWRDWFACGCATPRSVKVLTKWQAEKKICWYHWEVVDASCCDCVSKNANSETTESVDIAQVPGSHSFYKPAPEGAELGDVLPITDAEWVKLAAAMTPDPTETTPAVVANSEPKADPADVSREDNPVQFENESKKPSIAERVQRLFK